MLTTFVLAVVATAPLAKATINWGKPESRDWLLQFDHAHYGVEASASLSFCTDWRQACIDLLGPLNLWVLIEVDIAPAPDCSSPLQITAITTWSATSHQAQVETGVGASFDFTALLLARNQVSCHAVALPVSPCEAYHGELSLGIEASALISGSAGAEVSAGFGASGSVGGGTGLSVDVGISGGADASATGGVGVSLGADASAGVSVAGELSAGAANSGEVGGEYSAGATISGGAGASIGLDASASGGVFVSATEEGSYDHDGDCSEGNSSLDISYGASNHDFTASVTVSSQPAIASSGFEEGSDVWSYAASEGTSPTTNGEGDSVRSSSESSTSSTPSISNTSEIVIPDSGAIKVASSTIAGLIVAAAVILA